MGIVHSTLRDATTPYPERCEQLKKNKMVSEIVETILQIFIFSLIPFLVFVIKKRTVKGFLGYIGLKKSNSKANGLAILASLILLTPMLLLTLTSDSFQEIMFDPNSITGKLRAMEFGANSIIILLIIAIFKTSFAEEILFRGFIAKRLISIFGFKKGNIFQAIIFGILHTALFAIITTNFIFLSLIFIFPTIAAYLFGYLNEKKANGSIIPSWIAHGLANVITYIVVGFVI